MASNAKNQLRKFGNFIEGTCLFMCPEKERLMRERENLLHQLEKCDDYDSDTSSKKCVKGGRKKLLRKADPNKTVKCFSRSAAGHKAPDPSDLRPAPILEKTVAYLLIKIAGENTNDKYWAERYDFVSDRLRAVRQDMVIQNLPVPDSINILEPIVRFHCYSSYRLCEETQNTYDPKLNSTHLQECIKRLLVLYDSLIGSHSAVDDKLLRHQSEFEVLYLLLNLGDVNALRRALERNSSNKWELLALQLSLAWFHGNFVRVCRIVKDLPVLGLCVVSTQLPFLRKRALRVMTAAYSSKVLKVPMSYLETVLMWSSTHHAVHECNSYGIPVKTVEGEHFVTFLKGSLKNDTQEVRPRREEWIEERLLKYDFKDMMFPCNAEQLS